MTKQRSLCIASGIPNSSVAYITVAKMEDIAMEPTVKKTVQ